MRRHKRELRRFHDRLTNRRQRANKVPLVVNAADVEYEREQSERAKAQCTAAPASRRDP
jgi:hypothetical protein